MNPGDQRQDPLAVLKYGEYVQALPGLEEKSKAFDPVRIAILRSYTIEPIEPILRFLSIKDGWQPQLFVGGYNQYTQEVLDNGSALHEFNPHAVVFAVRLEEVLPALFSEQQTRTPDEWRGALADTAEQLVSLAERLVAANGCQVIIQNAALPAYPRPPLFESQAPGGMVDLVQSYNAALTSGVANATGVFLWDFCGFINKVGFDQVFDPRMWFLSRNPFAMPAYPAIAGDLYQSIRAMRGLSKKCIVVDLDNTLWGGVVGEDGLSGIKLGHDYPGNCFREFQALLLGLRAQGMLIAINSKNNEQDALDVFDKHPDSVLKRSDFSCLRINWQDKASNLVEIASELNIGLDSLIMIDDSEVECELIRQRLPDFDVYCLPPEPYRIPDFLSRIPGLQKIQVTGEDREKADMYRVQAERKSAEESFGSLEDFLESLQLRVTIRETEEFGVPRVAQLTQKTNQFNTTTIRYTESQISSFVGDESTQVFDVSVEDRFGEYGVVGVAILKYEGERCAVDSLLLSCRVIGRQVENALVARLVREAKARGAGFIDGLFVPSGKNKPAEDVYRALGFEESSEGRFSADLSDFELESPDFIRLEAHS